MIPFNKDQLQFLLQNSDDWQVALIDSWGQILFHLPSSPLSLFLKTHPVIFPKKFSIQPLEGAILVLTVGSSNGKAVTIIDRISHVQVTEETSAQRAELLAVIQAFQHLRDNTFNLLTDSRYIVGLFPHIETANIVENKTIIFSLLSDIQKEIKHRDKKYFVGHIRVHSGLPGLLHEGNALADALTKVIAFNLHEKIDKAKSSHKIHHQNAAGLRHEFHIPREAARQIVKSCPNCLTSNPSPPLGVNPRGLRPNALWQMDVTHTWVFGKLSFVQVTVDTFSHVITASARSGEAAKDVIQHLFQCFSQIGLPEQIKTDNAPAYTSAAFKRFCQQFSIVHSTGIPYNPQGQTIVERAHQTLKNQIAKLRQGEFKYSSPHHALHHALFVINHLNVDTRVDCNDETLDS